MKSLKVICALSIAIFIILASFFFLLLDTHFYSYEFRKQGIASSTGLTESQYISYTRQIVHYFFREGPLYVKDENGDIIKNLFSEREIKHMKDTKNIMRGALFTLFISFVIGLILILHSKERRIIFKYASIIILIFVFLIVSGVIIDFNDTFILFHKLLFRNNFWLLPANSTLILLFPESFFNDFALFWFITVAIIGAVMAFFSRPVRLQ